MDKDIKKEPETSSEADIQQAAEELTKVNEAGKTSQQQMPEAVIGKASQPANNQDYVKQIAANDLNKIQNLMKAGIITPAQGQSLVESVLKKAFNMMTQSGQNNVQPAQNQMQPQVAQDALSDEESMAFFNQDGRNLVLDYLKKSNVTVDKDEVSQICKLVEQIEKTAVEKYLKQAAHDKTLNDENEAAKTRLRANAQNAGVSTGKNKVFTREQIGKMSGAEFAKNERIIMEQLRKGLIR